MTVSARNGIRIAATLGFAALLLLQRLFAEGRKEVRLDIAAGGAVTLTNSGWVNQSQGQQRTPGHSCLYGAEQQS